MAVATPVLVKVIVPFDVNVGGTGRLAGQEVSYGKYGPYGPPSHITNSFPADGIGYMP